jgi:hypothetical protein
MDSMLDVSTKYALPAALAAVGAMYLDAKHFIMKDFRSWSAKRHLYKDNVPLITKMMGEYYGIYHAITFNDPNTEGFWFEGRSWTFGQITKEADKLAQWFIDQGIKTKGIPAIELADNQISWLSI